MAELTLVADKSGDVRLNAADKLARYREVGTQVRAVLAPERDLLACMASMVCLLHHALPHFFWTGFYRRVGPRLLRVGPYQGTLGCIDIPFERGVCGDCASGERSIIVADVAEYPGHIACDAGSVSEIVVPVFDTAHSLIAVLDVDSTIPGAFDEVDREQLEELVGLLRDKAALPLILHG